MKPRINDENISRHLDLNIDPIIDMLDKKDRDRERLIKISRELIRCSGQVVNYIIAEDLDRSSDILKRCSSLISELITISSTYPELLKTGIGLQAIIEFCEAEMLYRFIVHSTLECSYRDKYPEAYILALCDLSGEIKRLAILELSNWHIDKARIYINVINTIYNILKTLDYPDSITPGLRHKIDVLRRHIEDLETMFTDIKTRKDLIDMINRIKSNNI